MHCLLRRCSRDCPYLDCKYSCPQRSSAAPCVRTGLFAMIPLHVVWQYALNEHIPVCSAAYICHPTLRRGRAYARCYCGSKHYVCKVDGRQLAPRKPAILVGHHRLTGVQYCWTCINRADHTALSPCRVPFVYVFAVTGYVCWLLQHHYQQYITLRQQYILRGETDLNDW